MRAIALEDSCAGAHQALAMVLAFTDWNWADAEPEYQRALELDANDANTHAFYAHFLIVIRRSKEAVPHAERALKLDPFNALFRGMYAVVLLHDRRYDDAIAEARAVLSLQPNMSPARGALEESMYAKGMRAEFLAYSRDLIARNYPERLATFDRHAAEGGLERVQRGFADYWAEGYKLGKAVGARGIANRYMKAGDHDRALGWLEKSYEEHDPNLPYEFGLSQYDLLRSDPRFRSLLRRMNLPQ